MLAIARDKVSALSDTTRGRIEIVDGDMREFSLGRRFTLAVIPYGAFCHLLTPEDQRRALRCIRDHLQDGGRLALNMFDPSMEIIMAHSGSLGGTMKKHGEFVRPDNGNRVAMLNTRRYDRTAQLLNEDRVFEEMDREGRVVSRTYTPLDLRYTYGYEMEYLLELCGFSVEALYGDLQRGPFEYGKEQVWVARRVE